MTWEKGNWIQWAIIFSIKKGGVKWVWKNNEKLLKKLQNACKGVDFIARDITKTDQDIESVYNELES